MFLNHPVFKVLYDNYLTITLWHKFTFHYAAKAWPWQIAICMMPGGCSNSLRLFGKRLSSKEPEKILTEYLTFLLEYIDNMINKRHIVAGLGELMDRSQKGWVHDHLYTDLIAQIQMQIDAESKLFNTNYSKGLNLSSGPNLSPIKLRYHSHKDNNSAGLKVWGASPVALNQSLGMYITGVPPA